MGRRVLFQSGDEEGGAQEDGDQARRPGGDHHQGREPGSPGLRAPGSTARLHAADHQPVHGGQPTGAHDPWRGDSSGG